MGLAGSLMYVTGTYCYPRYYGRAHIGSIQGFANTIAVKPDNTVHHASEMALTIAEAMGINLAEGKPVGMEFYPPDLDRTRITRRLVEDLDWLGDQPLAIIQ